MSSQINELKHKVTFFEGQKGKKNFMVFSQTKRFSFHWRNLFIKFNMKPQRKNRIFAHYWVISDCKEKIQLWKRQLQARNFSLFPYTSEILAERKILDHH
jgi:hypothetical protein